MKRRGGARRGAGRKPVLTWAQRLHVGASVDSLLWRKTYARFDRELDAILAEDDLPQLWEGLHRLQQADPELLERQLSDIQASIEEGILQGRRYVTGPTRILPGIRRAILQKVADAASLRWHVAVSERMAERCLEEYRALRARIDADVKTLDPR